MEKGKKKLLIALCCVGGFFLALAIFLLVWFFGARYQQFDKLAREEFAIPGLSEGACPQGLCALPENAGGYDFAMSAYFDEGASKIWLIDGQDESRNLSFYVLDGKTRDDAHFGGVTCSDEYLYVASGSHVGCLALSDVFAAQDGGEIPAEYFDAGLGVAFLQYAQNHLYVGEFYRPGNYETDASHRLQTADGQTNPALVFVYEAGEGVGGIDSSAPKAALSVREQVQGIAVFDGGVALSCSYGLPDSGIWVYENVFEGEPQGSFSQDGKEIPLYMLDETCRIGTLTAPCMSEEIEVKDGRLYILFESKANKYKMFTRVRESHVRSVALEDLLALEK